MSRSNSAKAHLQWLFIGSSQNDYFLQPGGGGLFSKETVLLGQWESITGNLVLTTELKS